MAGHSKWANIKHKKEKTDASRGKVFTRVTKEIITAVKLGGSDPKANPRLRIAIQKAKAVNMPNDNIERNIKKASGDDQANYDEITYEIYGHGGVGIIVEVMTDNKNRAATDIRIAVNKRGGNIAQPGAVLFNFEVKGIIIFDISSERSEDELFELISETKAENIEFEDGKCIITTEKETLFEVKEYLESKRIEVKDAEITMLPLNSVTCEEEAKVANLALFDWIEQLDDVQTLYHNMEIV